MYDSAFTPKGPTVQVSGNAVQAVSVPESGFQQYRIRNVSSANCYFLWAPPLTSGQPPSVVQSVAVGPNPGGSVPNTIGMVGNSVEVFTLAPNAWFRGDATATLEVTPGEGV